MGNVRNVSDEDRFPAELGGRLVMPGQVVEVPDDSVYGYTCQDAWDAADKATQAIADKQEAANAEANTPATPEPSAEPDSEQDDEQPSGNASRDDWAAWVIAKGLATEEDLEGRGRDEIRDQYRDAEPDSEQDDDVTPAGDDDQTEDEHSSADDGDVTSQED